MLSSPALYQAHSPAPSPSPPPHDASTPPSPPPEPARRAPELLTTFHPAPLSPSTDPDLQHFPPQPDPDKKDILPPPPFLHFPLHLADKHHHDFSMPHRIEPYPMSSTHRRHTYDGPHHQRPSPPPIATLPHSPSPSVASLDRSSVNTPPIRRSPPHGSIQSHPHMYAPYPSDPSFYSRPQYPRDVIPHGYMYSHPQPPPPLDHRYDAHEAATHSPYHPPSALPPHMSVPSMHQQPRDPYAAQPYPHAPQTSVDIIHTSDAATKLSDRVRRRCFNCCTTDTSTWRRSNLSPGKVLCNKCGLFERTHSRPRPEQFPHKRGPLANSTLRSRSPPTAQLPPISSSPYNYHGPVAPLNQDPRHDYQQSGPLPALQTWHESGSPHIPPPPPRRATIDAPPPSSQGRAPSPLPPPPRLQAEDSREPSTTRENAT